MISKHFEKYFQKLKIDKIPLEELQYFVFEIKKSKLNTTLQLPNMPTKKNKKNIFCWLIYCLEIIDDNDGLDFLSKDLQDFFENVVANTDNQFFEDVIDYCLTLEKKKKENSFIPKSKRKPPYMYDTERFYNLSNNKKSRYRHAKDSIAAKLDDACYEGGDPAEIAVKLGCSVDRVVAHFKHLRKDLRLNGFMEFCQGTSRRKRISYVKIIDEYFKYDLELKGD